MQRALELATRMRKQLDNNWISELEAYNLYKCFEPIYRLEYNITTLNTLVCAIIFSYDNESKMIDLKQDGYDINKNILDALGADLSEPAYQQFVELNNEEMLYAVGNYLDLLPDWKYITARKQIDFHSKYVRSSEADMKELDEDKKIKARENIGRLIKESIAQRRAADELIELIEKENVATKHRVQQDFGVDYTQKNLEFYDNQSKKINPMSWRDFVKYTIIPMREKTKGL